MAWIDVRIIRDAFSQDADGLSKAQRVYFAHNDEPTAVDAAILASAGGVTVAVRGQSFSASRPRCIVINHSVERVGGNNPFQFEITIDFADPHFGPAETAAALLALPARISTADQEVMEEYNIDRSAPKQFVRNAVGEPFSKGPERLEGFTVYTIKKYVNGATRDAIKATKRKLNSSALTIDGTEHGELTLLLASASFDPVAVNADENPVWEATMVVKYKEDGWVDKVGNIGFRELIEGVPTKILEREVDPDTLAVSWNPITKAWPITFDGEKYSDPNTQPDVLEFNPYYQHDWTGVPLS